MTFKETIEAAMPDFVTSVKIENKANVKGLEAIKVIVNYRVHGKTMFLDMNFANKNHMSAEHIAAVVNSYLPNVPSES